MVSEGRITLVSSGSEPDWRVDREKAARELLVIVNDHTSYERGADGKPVRRWSPGSFVEQLIALLLRADATNTALIGIGFPAYAWAVEVYKHRDDGLDALRETAGWTDGGLNG